MDLRATLYAMCLHPTTPSPAAAFVFQHGKNFRGDWHFEFRQGSPKQCYGNAIVLAAESGLSYVEGFALAPNGVVVGHGWNAKADGTLIDSTWLNTGAAYLGVIFSVERGDDATWNKDAHVLDDKWSNPIFTREWAGEDFSLQWPHSERLDIFHTKNLVERRERYRKWLSENDHTRVEDDRS
jgi:hypothetical protein